MRHSLDIWKVYSHFQTTAYSSLWKFRMYVVGINFVSSSGKPNNVRTSSRPQISTQSKPRAVSRLPHHMSSCLRRPPVRIMRITSLRLDFIPLYCLCVCASAYFIQAKDSAMLMLLYGADSKTRRSKPLKSIPYNSRITR